VDPIGHWALGDRRLYLCTPDRPDLVAFVGSCIAGGVDIVQLREKQLPDGPLMERATLVQRVCASRGVPFILNDRPDLAAALGADGVHVGQDDMAPDEARRIVGDGAIVGLSTHAAAELDAAVGTPAEPGPPVDYISAGPVVPTPTKPGRPGTGLDYVSQATGRAPWSVWVTGGVDPGSVSALAAAGARHFVVVRWLTGAADPEHSARLLRSAIDEVLGQLPGGAGAGGRGGHHLGPGRQGHRR
jgi:thiamine-phosphate pyrophosphorylase